MTPPVSKTAQHLQNSPTLPSTFTGYSTLNLSVQLADALARKIPSNIRVDLTILQQVLQKHETTFRQLASSFSNLTAVYSQSLPTDNAVKQQCHSTFLENYVPVKTPAFGDCLWQMISICLCQQPVCTTAMRLLTVYTMMKYKDVFLQLLRTDNAQSNSDNLEQFKELILDARTCRHWGNEYHL